MKCRKHDFEMHMVRCPDKKPGCLVAHFACLKCSAEKSERETLEALQQANGVLLPSDPHEKGNG